MADRVDEPLAATTIPAASEAPLERTYPRGLTLPKTFSALRHRNYRLFFQRAAHFAHWHLDAERRAGMAGVQLDRLALVSGDRQLCVVQ